jgi:hypothetical protein
MSARRIPMLKEFKTLRSYLAQTADIKKYLHLNKNYLYLCNHSTFIFNKNVTLIHTAFIVCLGGQ